MDLIFELAINMTKDVAATIVKDASYIPADKLGWSPMGSARSAAAILAEVGGANFGLASFILGETSDDSALRARAEEAAKKADFNELKALIDEGTERICSAIATVKPEDLSKEIALPWGFSLSMGELIFMSSKHMSYHDGQINYIQTLLGDDKMHWTEG